MKVEILKFEHTETKSVPAYGGTKIVVEYYLTTVQNDIKNEYKVFGEIRGIETADLYINFYSVEAITNNEETLTEEAVIDLIESI